MKIGNYTKVAEPRQIALPTPLNFNEFTQLESVSYFLSQLRRSRFKNLPVEKNNFSGTQRRYCYNLLALNNWLIGKQFEINQTRWIDSDTYKKTKTLVTFTGIEHLLELCKESQNSDSDYIKIVKLFLLDDIHKNKAAITMDGYYFAITSYFEKNECPLIFKFSGKYAYENKKEGQEPKTLSLEDFMKILTVGKPSILQKAVFICKFQRGLDSSTLTDRFNFEAWLQIVKHFGTEQYMMWDLEKCPVPIKLVRIKTGFLHTGFLDRDAIESLQDYLDYRYKKTGHAMAVGEPLFLNTKNTPISSQWIRKRFFELAKRAGVQKKIGDDQYVKYEKDSHELRDLLKSTLLASGTRYDVADHVIGHKPKDSYEKQATLYPENLRLEYMKGSRKLNIFSSISHYMKGEEQTEMLRKQIDLLKQDLEASKNIQPQTQKMEEVEIRLLQLQHEVGSLRRESRSNNKVIRIANTILYKNRNKIPGLDMKRADPKYFVKDKDLEKNYIKIYETDLHYFEIDKQSQSKFSNKIKK